MKIGGGCYNFGGKSKALSHQRIVIKIGSNVITQPDGSVNIELLQHLCWQVSQLKQQGKQVLIVSSGAVAAGRGIFPLQKKVDPVTRRQLLAAVGQNQLMQTYTRLFQQHNDHCAQVLVTKEDFRSRRHYLNIRNCLEGMLAHKVIPVINENDVVSVTELMFTDNDELAGLVAAMLDVHTLIILTNVAGLYDRNPKDPEAQLITSVDSRKFDFADMISAEKSEFGRGGMLTKARMAQKLAAMGIDVFVAGGKTENILLSVIAGEAVGTRFSAIKKTTGVKRWIGHADGYVNGKVYVNEGAKNALLDQQKANSLLPVGIVRIEGNIKKNDIVALCDADGISFGLGKARYDGKQIKELIGKHGQKPFIHYDYMYLFE